MKRRHLRRVVVSSIYILVLGLMATGILLLSQNILRQKEQENEHYNYTMSVFGETDIPVVVTTESSVILPYQSESVSVAKDFYQKDDTEDIQQHSLIYYEGTYMPNTGILYESEEPFDVLAITDGMIKDIKQDEILGTVLTLEYNTKLTSIYYTLGEVKVNVGDQVTQGQVIATSGSSKLETSKNNTLLIETYLNANLINPNSIFSKKLSELE